MIPEVLANHMAHEGGAFKVKCAGEALDRRRLNEIAHPKRVSSGEASKLRHRIEVPEI
jgi:hypothetical protein